VTAFFINSLTSRRALLASARCTVHPVRGPDKKMARLDRILAQRNADTSNGRAYRAFALCVPKDFSNLWMVALRSLQVSLNADKTFEFDPLWLLCHADDHAL